MLARVVGLEVAQHGLGAQPLEIGRMVGVADDAAAAVPALGEHAQQVPGDLAVPAGDEYLHPGLLPAPAVQDASAGKDHRVTVLQLIAAFVLIVGGAIGFTNAVEWLGHRLNLAEGAVGALLAAVGTALPESVIPVVALIDGGGDAESVEVAVGAIVGAPFLLGTLAMLLIAVSVHAFAGRREQGTQVTGEQSAIRRDLAWFLVLFTPAILLGVLHVPAGVRYAAAALLVVGYGLYVRQTLVAGGDPEAESDLGPLYFDTTKRRSADHAGRSRRSSSCRWPRSSAARSCSSAWSRASPPRSA